MRRIALCAAVFALMAARVCLILAAGRTVRIAARINNPHDPRPVNPRDPRLVNNPRDPRLVNNPRDPRLVDDPPDPRRVDDPRDPRHANNPRDPRHANNPRDPRPVDDPPDPRPVLNPRPVDTPSNPRSATAPWIRDLSSAVIAVGARRPFSATCLEQGVALVMLLTIARIPATLVVGVTRAESAFRAHAWVECGGVVVLGGAQSQGFTPLLRVTAQSRPSAVSASCPG